MNKRRKLGKLSVIVVCLAAVLLVCAACGNEEDGPRSVAQRYFDAVKAGDVNGAIECFTPAFQQQYKSTVALGGMLGSLLGGVDGSSLLGVFMSYATQDAYKDCQFTADTVVFTDKKHEHATVHVSVDGAGDGIPSEANLKMVKYDDQWYVEQ